MVLPDGSRTLIPAAWTDWNVHPDAALVPSEGDDAGTTETLCTTSDLLSERAVTDALLSRLFESAPAQEGDDAVRVGVLERPVEPDEGSQDPWDQIGPQAQIAALMLLSRLIAQKLASKTARESRDE